MWHFVKLVVRGFLWILRFPPLLHQSMLSVNKRKLKPRSLHWHRKHQQRGSSGNRAHYLVTIYLTTKQGSMSSDPFKPAHRHRQSTQYDGKKKPQQSAQPAPTDWTTVCTLIRKGQGVTILYKLNSSIWVRHPSHSQMSQGLTSSLTSEKENYFTNNYSAYKKMAADKERGNGESHTQAHATRKRDMNQERE